MRPHAIFKLMKKAIVKIHVMCHVVWVRRSHILLKIGSAQQKAFVYLLALNLNSAHSASPIKQLFRGLTYSPPEEFQTKRDPFYCTAKNSAAYIIQVVYFNLSIGAVARERVLTHSQCVWAGKISPFFTLHFSFYIRVLDLFKLLEMQD